MCLEQSIYICISCKCLFIFAGCAFGAEGHHQDMSFKRSFAQKHNFVNIYPETYANKQPIAWHQRDWNEMDCSKNLSHHSSQKKSLLHGDSQYDIQSFGLVKDLLCYLQGKLAKNPETSSNPFCFWATYSMEVVFCWEATWRHKFLFPCTEENTTDLLQIHRYSVKLILNGPTSPIKVSPLNSFKLNC